MTKREQVAMERKGEEGRKAVMELITRYGKVCPECGYYPESRENEFYVYSPTYATEKDLKNNLQFFQNARCPKCGFDMRLTIIAGRKQRLEDNYKADIARYNKLEEIILNEITAKIKKELDA